MADSNVTYQIGGSNQSTEFDGTIEDDSGTVALTTVGTGTLTLTGENTYSGTTTINSGSSLQVDDGGTTGTLGSGGVTNNGTLGFDRSDSMSVGNAISGTGNLVQQGTGTLTLTSTNTYSGGTTINDGSTLQLGNNSAIGTDGVTVNGTLDLNGYNPTINGLSGTGSVTSNGTGTSTLSVGYGNADGNFSGVLSGPVALTKLGAGTLTLAATNTYSGGTTINGGILEVGDGNATGSLGYGDITIADDASLEFCRSNVVTESYAISGMGSVVQDGDGTLYLTGDNTYSGGTTINDGVLGITGSITSAVTVASGATLSGTGNTGAVTANGTVSPGVGGVGTLNTGNLLFNSGSHYNVDLDSSGNDQVNVTNGGNGTVSLGNASLDITSTRADIGDDLLVLIKNDGTNLVSGTFLDLSEGAEVDAGSSRYWITYCYNAEAGTFGDGNDVALLNYRPAVTAVSNTEIDLSWPNNATATGYKIERMTNTTAWTQIATRSAGVTSYSDTGLTEGTAYYYRVKATIGSVDYSSSMNYAITLPTAPDGLSVSFANGGEADLTWTAYSSKAVGYSIEQLVGSTWQQVQTTAFGTGTMNASVIGVFDPSTPYTFRVRAYENDFSGNPLYSAPATHSPVQTPDWPAAPTDLTATAVSNTEIDLNWTDTTGETGYKIERSDDGIAWTQIGTAAADATSYPDTAVTEGEGTLRYYRVRATKNGVWDSAYTSVSAATTLPATPTDLQATIVDGGQVNLTWDDNSTIETSYSIEQLMADGVTWQEVQTTDPGTGTGTMSLAVTGPFEPLADYHFRVKAYTESDDFAAYSAPSNGAMVTALAWPTAPTNLTTTVVSNAEIGLTWTDSATNEMGYEIDRTTDGNTWTVVTDTLPANTTSYSDIGLTDGTLYGYRVRAVNSLGGSGYAINAAATLPTAPTNLQATVVSGTEIDLSWTASDYATGYTISMQAEGSDTWQVIGTVPATQTTYAATGLAAGGTYYAFCVAPSNSTAASAVAYLDPQTLNGAPTIASTPSAGANPVTTTSTTLTVLGADDGGEGNLTYSWSVVSGPSDGGAYFSLNDSNAAKNTTVTFYAAGDFRFQVTVTDAQGAYATSTVDVTVQQTLMSITVTPGIALVSLVLPVEQTQQFTADATDQFGNDMSPQPVFTWNCDEYGDISQTGLYTIPEYPIMPGDLSPLFGSAWVTAGGKRATAEVCVDSSATEPGRTLDFFEWGGECHTSPTFIKSATTLYPSWLMTSAYPGEIIQLYDNGNWILTLDGSSSPSSSAFVLLHPGSHNITATANYNGASLMVENLGMSLLHGLNVSDHAYPADSITTNAVFYSPAETKDLYVAANDSQTAANIDINAIIDATPSYYGDMTSKDVHLTIRRGDDLVVDQDFGAGSTLSNEELPITQDAHDFVITAWFDGNRNGLCDAWEETDTINVHVVKAWTIQGTWTTGHAALVTANADGASLADLAKDITGNAADASALGNVGQITRGKQIDVTPLLKILDQRIRDNVKAAANGARI